MKYFEFIEGGIRKHFDWGYSEVYMPKPEDCFSPDQADEVIVRLSALPKEALSLRETQLLAALIAKRKGR